jgi:hypothetical protein
VINDRPFGIIILAVLSILGATQAGFMTLQVLQVLPEVSGPGFVVVPNLFVALICGLLALAFAHVAYVFWTINLSDWYSVLSISVLNLALIILSGMSLAVSIGMMGKGSSRNLLLSGIMIYGGILTYCLLLDKKRAFWSIQA